MKKLLLILLCLPMIGFGQTFNHNVKNNVRVSGHVSSTQYVRITDYGKLALAEAERERTRLDAIKFDHQKDKEIANEIIVDPSKAYDYGTFLAPFKLKRINGFKRVTYNLILPHASLFNQIDGAEDLLFQNISSNYVTTNIIVKDPVKLSEKLERDFCTMLVSACKSIISNTEEYAKADNIIEGKQYEISDTWNCETYGVVQLHKKDVSKARLFGVNGFLQTLVYEDEYEIIIRDNYYASDDGIAFLSYVEYKGDKNQVTFEDLESRRYYFKM